MTWRVAWRNLWRNPRRTWLTAGGIAFAHLLVASAMSLQAGGYAAMINNATSFLMGQAQISHPQYIDDQKVEYTIAGATELLREIAQAGVRAAPRAQGYGLISAGERSFGGLISGVDFAAEERVVSFFESLKEGRLPHGGDEVLIGTTMARNLGVGIGDELVMLGTAKEGGVAALAANVSGIFESGVGDLDRTFLFVPLAEMQLAFALGDEVHQIVLRTDDVETIDVTVAALKQQLEGALAVRSWTQYMPDVVQGIEIDRVSARMMYGVILILVSFSVVNTFLMIVFERTREFGMLLSIGMRPAQILRQISIEAFGMWLVGTALGLVLSILLVGYLATEGISMEGMDEIASSFYMDSSMYAAFTWPAMTAAPAVLLLGTQLAALIGWLRVRGLRPVEAMRTE